MIHRFFAPKYVRYQLIVLAAAMFLVALTNTTIGEFLRALGEQMR